MNSLATIKDATPGEGPSVHFALRVLTSPSRAHGRARPGLKPSNPGCSAPAGGLSLALGGSRARWLSDLHPKVNAGPSLLSAQVVPAFLSGLSPVSRSQVSKCQQAALAVGHRESSQLGAVSADPEVAPSAANCCPSSAPTCFQQGLPHGCRLRLYFG